MREMLSLRRKSAKTKSLAAREGSTTTAANRSRYQIIVPIGAGAMGTIHLAARADSLGGEPAVVVKRLNSLMQEDPRARAALATEAMCVSSIDHENVVRFVDFDIVDGVAELVLEHIDGATLSELALEGTALAPSVAFAIATQLCAALEAVQSATDANGHPLGIVHRDISAQNVMVDVAGVVKLIDFGVARVGGDEDRGLFGKVSYMAPETLETGLATNESDLFSLSVVLWELFAGRRFEDADVPSLKSAVGAHACALDPIFARALSSRPSARFPTVADLRRALEGAGIAMAPRTQVAEAVTRARVSERLDGAPAAAPVPRMSFRPFDVDRPAAESPREAHAGESRRGLRGALKWAGLLGIVAAIAGATTALVQFAEEAPAQGDAVETAVG